MHLWSGLSMMISICLDCRVDISVESSLGESARVVHMFQLYNNGVGGEYKRDLHVT